MSEAGSECVRLGGDGVEKKTLQQRGSGDLNFTNHCALCIVPHHQPSPLRPIIGNLEEGKEGRISRPR